MRPDLDSAGKLRALAQLERRHALFAFRVDGWSAWRVVRNPLHRMAEGLPLAQPARSNGRRSAQALLATFRLLRLLAGGARRELLLKTCRSGLRLPQGEGYRDVYFDGLLGAGHGALKLEEINSPDFDRQAAAACHPADLDPVVFTFWGRVLGLLLPLKAGPFCADVAALLEREVGLAVPARWLRARLSTVYWQARLYTLLLRRVRPAAVLVSDTGEYALRIACQRCGVRFIELQHGVFDAQHPDAIPAWVEGAAAELLLPDVLACRGAYWIEQLAGTRQGRDHAVAVGNELIDLARASRHGRRADGRLRLVLSTQGLDSERLAQWLEAMLAAAPAGLDWELAIKLHPVYDAGTRAFDGLRGRARVRVIGGAEQPHVFELLAQADLHLSIASACHFDAAALGVASVVIPLAGHEAMLGAVDGTQIALARQPGDVWALAAAPAAPAARAHHYATPGFIGNLQRLLG
ncbi:hypothetical protein [Janthinobacterium fluminis]|uniref:Capsule polysaccharide biosynthesis protein n=1 Tax=Janthinobacterium fluminis TaxID=2987524 RepID=A0ABT5K455_9BURK|nr:hypothetical protein [Janthinobacterium fluminis]MDC8758876.1 hypothetical protein [Janthinobacterium fluminis]